MEATVIKDDINSRIELVDKGLVKQHIRTARSSEQVRAMAEVVRFCHLNGAKVPEIVKVEGRFVYTKFVRGEQYFGSQKELKSLARELALLHNCLLACPIQYNWRPGEVSYRLERFRPKKVQLIHGDMQPTNVLFSRRAVAVILDFGAMRKGEPIQDIAFAAFRFGKSRQAINFAGKRVFYE
jgi:tRNA A-37 threonylcarbamoyl transferase component Bud32